METLHHRRWLTGIIAWFVFIQAWGQLQAVNFGWGIATVLVLSVAAMLLIPKLCYSRMEWYIIGAGVTVGVVGWWEGNAVGLPWGAYCFASLVGSWLLVGKLGCSLDNVQQVASDLALVSRVRDVQDSELGDREFERELRRARRHGRSTTMLVVRVPEDASAAGPSEKTLSVIRQRFVQQYAMAQLSLIMANETKESDVVSVEEGRMAILLPETDAEQANAVVERIRARARDILDLDVAVGASSFPAEEITLAGLIELAEQRLNGETDSQSAPTVETDHAAPPMVQDVQASVVPAGTR